MTPNALNILLKRPVSSDHFKTASRCAKKFWLQYIQQLNWPSDTRRFELGQSVHKLMEYQAKGLDIASLVNAASDNIRVCWEKLQQHPASVWPIIASEWAFSVPVYFKSEHLPQKCWITGRMDRVAWQAETRTLWILDWKTGTAAPKQPLQDWQTRVYLWAMMAAYQTLRDSVLDESLKQLLPEKLQYAQLKFMYLETGSGESTQPLRPIVVDYSFMQHQEFEQAICRQFEKLLLQAQQNDFPLPRQCPDMYCPYHPVCGIKDVATSELILKETGF